MAFSDNWAAKNAQSQLSAAVASEEKRINDTYLAIGKAYAQAHMQDPDGEFADMVVVIADAQEKIATYREQIREIKGLVVCEKCGAEVANTSAFCTSCGEQMPIPEDKIRCTGCGRLVSKDIKFCTFCGKLMMVMQTPLTVEAPEEPTRSSSPCPHCGAPVEDGMAFCAACGVRMQPAAETVAQPTIMADPVPVAEQPAPVIEEPAPVVEQPAPIPVVEPVPVPPAPAPQGKVCPHCGALAEDGMAFCTNCGKSLSAPQTPEQPAEKRCPRCGAIAEPDMAFCTACGQKL